MDKKTMMAQMIKLAGVGIVVSANCEGSIGPFYADLFARLDVEMREANHRDDPDLSSLWEETQSIISVCAQPWSLQSYAEAEKTLDRYRQIMAAA